MSKKVTTEEFIQTIHPRFGKDPNYYICVFSKSKDTLKKQTKTGEVIGSNYPSTRNSFFNDIDEFNDYIYKNKNNYNLYYSIAEVDGKGRKSENIKSVSSIVLDFDFHNCKPPKAQEITEMIRNKMKIYITSIVDTGHGFQVIIPIEETTDINRWNKLMKHMVNFFLADVNASHKTQVMRLPNTFNYKDIDKPMPVNAVYLKKGTVYTLDKLEKMLYNAEHSSFSKTISDFKPCIKSMMKGVPKGHRNFCLGRITYELIRLHYTYEDAKKEVLLFNSKCTPLKLDPIVINDFNAYWNGVESNKYNLGGCQIKDENGNVIKTQNDILQTYCKKDICNRSKKVVSIAKERNDVIGIPSLLCNSFLLNQLKGNELALLVEIFINNGLSKKDIINNYGISKPTINNCIKTLLTHNLITEENNEYKFKSHSTDRIDIDPNICKRVLNKKVQPALLPIYLLICYLNNNKDYPSVIKISQLLNIDKGNVSKAIHTLMEDKYIHMNMSAFGAGVTYHISAA